MASFPFSSLFITRNPKSLSFTSNASPLRFQTSLRPKSDDFSSVCLVSRKTVFPKLQANDLRHPLDKQNAERFRAMPDLYRIEEALRCVFAADPRFLEHHATSILTGPKQLSTLYNLMAEAAEILQFDAPPLYVKSSPIPLARTIAVDDTPSVVVHTSLLELLTLPELQVVFACELGHLKCGHVLWLTLADMLVHEDKALPVWLYYGVGGLYSGVKELVCWRKAAELSSDRASLLVAQDPKVVISVMMKLAGDCPTVKEPNVEAYLAQACAYIKSSSLSPTWRDAKFAYPVPEEHANELRAYEIDQWSRSKEYRRLLSSATQGEQLEKQVMEKHLLDSENGCSKVFGAIGDV